MVLIFQCSVQKRENTDQENLRILDTFTQWRRDSLPLYRFQAIIVFGPFSARLNEIMIWSI